MSDTDSSQNDSLWSNLTNKVKYTLHKAAYDPDANQFAQKKQEQAKEQKTDSNSTDNEQSPLEDPNKFSIKRLLKKSGNQFIDTMKKIMPAFISLMLAMIVTNEMIVYSVPIRIIFFIFTFIVTYTVSFAAVVLGIFYLLKGSYSYYYNNMTDRPKKNIMPTIFALLPITTSISPSPFISALMYPFTYPKTDLDRGKLPELMKEYWGDLQESFKDFDKVKSIPVFVDDLKQIQIDLSKLHNSVGPLLNLKLNSLPTTAAIDIKNTPVYRGEEENGSKNGANVSKNGTNGSKNGANGSKNGANGPNDPSGGNGPNEAKNGANEAKNGANEAKNGTNGANDPTEPGNGTNGNNSNVSTKSALLGNTDAKAVSTDFDKKAAAITAAVSAHKAKTESE